MSDDRLFSDVPVLPQPAYAGFPSPGDDYADPPLNVHDLVVAHPLATYLIRVSGDSMTGACICAGDVVVVDRALTPGNNAIVVARVGKDLLLKRLKMRQRKIFHHPAPPWFPVIKLREHDEIWGIVTHCIHRVR